MGKRNLVPFLKWAGSKSKIKVRRALHYYTLKRLELDSDPGPRKPQDRQIVLLKTSEVLG